MKKHIKIALFLIVCGAALLFIGYSFGGFKSISMSSHGFQVNDDNYVTDTKDLESFENIDLDLDIPNIEIIGSDNYSIETCYNKSKKKIDYELKNNTLKVRLEDNSTFSLQLFSNDCNSEKVKIYVPENVHLKKLKVKTDYSSTKISNIDIENIDINSLSGSLNLNDIKSNTLSIERDSGHTSISNTTVLDNMTINSSSGSINLNDITCSNSLIKRNSGSLKGDNINADNLTLKSQSGSTNLSGEFKGSTSVDSKSGSINITTSLSENEYSYKINTESGSLKLNDNKINNAYEKNNTSSHNNFTIKSGSGSIKINTSM